MSDVETPVFRGRIGVVGAGALGSFYGAKLARAGFDVHFLMRRDYEAVRRYGLRVFSISGDFEIRPNAYNSPEAMGFCDLVAVGLKTTANGALPALLGPVTTPDSYVLTLQNGLGAEDDIADALAGVHGYSGKTARSRVIGGTAFLCSSRGEPGEIHHTAVGHIRVAPFEGTPMGVVRAIASSFEKAGVPCEVFESLMRIRWEKLIWNIPFNGLGVVGLGADTQIVMNDAGLLGTAEGLMDEVIAAARADGIEIDPAFARQNIELTRGMGPYKSSMQIDWEQGRPMEIEALLGEPLRRALNAGIATPRLGMLYALARAVAERGARS